MQDRNPSFSGPRYRPVGPLSSRPSGWRAWWHVIEPALIVTIIVTGVFGLMVYSGLAWSQVNPAFDRSTCWVWGGSGSAGQGQYASCPTNVVTVTRTEVREVKVPVPVPGPVRIERVEVPAPAPAKKVRD